MKAKVIYWVAVASLAFYVLKSVILFHLGWSLQDVLAIGLWVFLAWMLFRRPKSWGFGIGIFLLGTIAIQAGLLRLAMTSPRKEELGITDSWSLFILSAIPLFLGGVCGISLRWLYPEPNQSLQPTGASARG